MVRNSQRATDEARHAQQVTLRFSRPDERPRALADIKAWGYRELDDGEADGSTWVALERGEARVGWWWLQWGTSVDAILHMCAAPGEVILTRHTLQAMEWVAELFGAKQLLVVPPDDGPVAGYMRRLGWLGWREVGEGVFSLRTRRAAGVENR